MNNLVLALLRDPAAIVELFAALVAACYLLQLLLTQEEERVQTVRTQPLRVQESERPLFASPIFPAIFPVLRLMTGAVKAGAGGTVRGRSGRCSTRIATHIASSRYGRLSRRDDVENFNRAIFSDLSDSGSLFPAERLRKAQAERNLKLYGVGSYVSSPKRSLRKSSAQRLRLPE